MDKQVSQSRKRPRVLTLCMLAATVSTLALAGCGNGEDEMPPAQQPDTMEQDATTTTAPATGNEPTMADELMNEDPGLGEDPAATQEPMPGENTQTGAVNDPEENPGSDGVVVRVRGGGVRFRIFDRFVISVLR